MMHLSASTGLSRRRCLQLTSWWALTAVWAAQPSPSTAASCTSAAWPLFDAFVQRCVQDDGRVIDISTPPMQSTSEGQAYGNRTELYAFAIKHKPEFS